MASVVERLSTCFATPEELIFKQDDKADELYFISRGDCAVNIRDEKRVEHIAVKLLVEGDHFGEIGLVYGVRRTASIVSRNYNTMASLNADRFRDLLYEFPIYRKYLKKHLFTYKYTYKTFLRNIANRIEYL